MARTTKTSDTEMTLFATNITAAVLTQWDAMAADAVTSMCKDMGASLFSSASQMDAMRHAQNAGEMDECLTHAYGSPNEVWNGSGTIQTLSPHGPTGRKSLRA